MKKLDNLKEFEESVLAGDRVIKETYPLEDKKVMLCHVTVYPIRHGGDAFQGADVFIDHCCKKNEAVCNELFIQRSNVPAGGRDPANFLKVLYKGNPIDVCPFCGGEIKVVQEPREAQEHWY